MSNYGRGTAFERRIKVDLEEGGYWVVRAAGSHGKADLVAIKPGQILLVQCKINGVLAPAERTGLAELATTIQALAIIAWRPTPQTRAFRELTNPHIRGGQYRPFLLDQIPSL